jgi:hypothetical protein
MEVVQAYQWIIATQKADTALTAKAVGSCWQEFAPMGTLAPYTLTVEQANTDVLTMNAYRVFASLLLQIKAVGPSANFDDLTIIANRIDALFGRVKNIPLSPGYMLSSYRESEISNGELVNGASWSNLGGLYRVLVQGS